MSNNLAVDYIEERRGFTTPCWIWQGVANNKGYGLVRRNNKRLQLAHVYYFEKFGYVIPKGQELDHLCQIPLCCNPHHMEPVTHTQNMRRAKNVKLSMEIARDIRRKYNEATRKWGMLSILAREYGTYTSTIHMIITGKLWKEDM